MKVANSIPASYGTTVFTWMSAHAVERGAVNLGQGFPDEEGLEDPRRAAAGTVISGPNQYPPMLSLPELRPAVARHNRRFYGLDVDGRMEVLVTLDAPRSARRLRPRIHRAGRRGVGRGDDAT